MADWQRPLALGVSGGGDSMAMLGAVLAYRQTKKLDTPIFVFTVNHGLRKGAAQEAAYVAQFCKARAIAHKTLFWRGEKPDSRRMQAAREARLSLLWQACQSHTLSQLLLAHTLDDQAETLLMRVRRGGFRGHAAMDFTSYLQGVQIMRPFLCVRREALRQQLKKAGIAWCEDPANTDARHERTQARAVLAKLETTCFNATRLARYAEIMGRWRRVMAREIAQLLEAACALDEATGSLDVKAGVFASFPAAVAIQGLREMVRFVGGQSHMICFKTSKGAYKQLMASEGRKAFSAGRCVFAPQRKAGLWRLRRALRHLPETAPALDKQLLWDGRFLVHCAEESQNKALITPHPDHPLTPCVVRKGEDGASASLPARIQFYPKVMQGPLSMTDIPIFEAFGKLLKGAKQRYEPLQ